MGFDAVIYVTIADRTSLKNVDRHTRGEVRIIKLSRKPRGCWRHVYLMWTNIN